MFHLSSQAENKFNFLSVLFRSSVDRVMPTHTAEGHLFYLVRQFKCWSLLETPPPTHPEIMCNQLSGHPLA